TPTFIGPDSGNLWRAGSGRVVPTFGRAWLVTQFNTASTTLDDGSIVLLGLGGWSSATLGEMEPSEDGESFWWGFGSSTEWSGVAAPIALPDDLEGWAESTSGSPTIDLVDGAFELDVGTTSAI